MPKELEEALRAQASKKGLKGKRRNAYIYGTLEKYKKRKAKKESKSS